LFGASAELVEANANGGMQLFFILVADGKPLVEKKMMFLINSEVWVNSQLV